MFANVNGYKLFFDVEGLQWVPDGPQMHEKPVCLVLHGGPGSDHTHFLPALSELSKTMQLIYIDDRNCGRSERIDCTTNSIKQNVDDIEEIRKYLGLDKVFVIGKSYGGMKAQRYAIDYSEHLYGAIICCTTACADGLDKERVLKHVIEFGTPEQVELWKSDALIQGEISFTEYLRIMGPLYHGKDKFDIQSATDDNMRGIKADDVMLHQMKAGGELKTFDLRPELRKITVPCMIIAGERDFICDAEANREIHNCIPGSEFHVIKDSSHEIFADYPEIVFPLIKDFVNRYFKN